MRRVLAVLGGIGVAVVGGVVWLSPAGALPSAEGGADIAARWCAACHVVSPLGGGNEQGPSFPDIAYQRSDEQIRDILLKPHGRPMGGFTLSPPEINDLLEYFRSLGE